MKLTDDEVLLVLDLVEKSHFGELNLQMGDLHIKLIKGVARHSTPEPPGTGSAVPVTFVTSAATSQEPLPAGDREGRSTENGAFSPDAAQMLSIKAPLIGTFYRKPEPGAPPFVEPGAFVEEETTVCLIETMKVFTSVKAGVRGYVEEICAEDAQMVEYGQTLFRVRPE